MQISLIAAASENNVIGRGGHIPWNLPNDLQYFKDTTSGHPIIMGRKTHESIGRPLPGRLNIIVTRNAAYRAEGCETVASLDEALTLAEKSGTDEAFVIGGAEIYQQALPLAHRMYLTRVHEDIEGDAVFPVFSPDEWHELSRSPHPADEDHEYAYTFFVYERA